MDKLTAIKKVLSPSSEKKISKKACIIKKNNMTDVNKGITKKSENHKLSQLDNMIFFFINSFSRNRCLYQ